MRGALFPFWVIRNRQGEAALARFARLSLRPQIGCHQLASPADLPTNVS